MSRIGNLPINIEKGAKVELKDNSILIQGPKGQLSLSLRPEVKVVIKDEKILVSRESDQKKVKALHGLYRNLINNMMQGVTKGFQKILLINGVGYRAEKKGKNIIFNLGYSNPIEYPIPEGVNIEVEANTKLILTSHNKEKLGQVCAEIKRFKLPEPYKGKGIRFEDEHIRKKVGKTGVK